jgi:hypothetical protein
MRLKFSQKGTASSAISVSANATPARPDTATAASSPLLDDAIGKVGKLRHGVALTKEMTVEYIKPVPLCSPCA